MKTALIHDWLTGYRGGEKVLEIFCELLPKPDIYTVIYKPGTTTDIIEQNTIKASWLNRLPGVGRYYRYLLPVMPLVAQRTRVKGYDLVIAVNHCVAHGIDASESGKFICYYLTPMRYAWGIEKSYFSNKTAMFDPRYWILKFLRGYLQQWDRLAAGRVSYFITDCENIRKRVKTCYGFDSTVIYPPVDTNFFQPLNIPREGFYLWAGALAPYKRIDLAINAFKKLNRQLVVIGEGQFSKTARKKAPSNVLFLGRQPDNVLHEYYARCKALIFPGEEDFGIVPLEAQACGTPVIAYGKGGALETVRDLRSSMPKPTGLYFNKPTVESLIDTIRLFEENENEFCSADIRTHAEQFSKKRCKDALKEYLFKV